MRSPVAWIGRLKTRIPSPGPLAVAAFAICALSGLPLLLVYRPGAPLESLARAMMTNPIGTWVRSVHYWSAQGFLVGAVLHLIVLLRRGEEKRMAFAAWFRLILAGPVILVALVTGCILRGDAAAERVAAVFRALVHVVPPGGNLLAAILLGSGSSLTVVCWHHALTASLAVAILLRLHFGRVVPEARSLGLMSVLIAALSVIWVPGLGAYPQATASFPWYFAGVQQWLRWVPEPGLAVGLGVSAWIALALLPAFDASFRTVAKWSLAAGFLAYALLTGFELARRYWPGATGAPPIAQEFVSARSYVPVPSTLRRIPVASIAGRPEGCLSCHGDMNGFSPAHQPAALGCTSCHLGNPFTLDAALAHAGMTLTPGNLSVVRQTCAAAGCHADIVGRVQASPMNTMSGVVGVDKVVFGESRDLDRPFDVAHLGHSPADRHLRNLCASCHLGQDKAQPAAISQQSRGGGCSACHLDYGPEARRELHNRPNAARTLTAPRNHPDISIRVPAAACFGCHSRSGRISTNFEGWHETTLDASAAQRASGWPRSYRVLDDGRVFVHEAADVHYEKGMICTDCHLASEVMGDGARHAHEEDAVKIACTDCHSDRPPATAGFTEMEQETQRIVALRQLNRAERRFVRARSGDVTYPNVFVDESGTISLVTVGGAVLQPKAPARACGRDITAHQKLECRACHSAWAPQCITCHTTFDPKAEGWDHLAGRLVRGVWQETGGDYRAEPPVLGVRRATPAGGPPAERIGIFVPGMIMTLNQTTGATPRPDEFHRRYAPTSPHTTVSAARDCRSCHADSLALGYGRGVLKYQIRDGRGHWAFNPALPTSGSDGLPADAWIGFLEEPGTPAATRKNVRPFNRDEQRRMLLVGACLQCHSEKEPRLAAVFADFDHYRDHLSPRCVLPGWEQ